MNQKPAPFIWHGLITTDVEAARTFYAKVIGWNELHAGDGLEAFDWYAEMFGWTLSRDMDIGPMGVYRLFATGGEPAGRMVLDGGA